MASTPTGGTDPLPGTTDSTLGGGGIGSTNNALGYGAQPGAGTVGTGMADELAGSDASRAAGYDPGSLSGTGSGVGTAGAGMAGSGMSGGGMSGGSASSGSGGSASGGMGGGSTMDDLKSKAGEYADQATGKAREYAEGAKDKAADGLHSAADAARDVADKLAETQAAPVADYARRAAEGIDRFSETLQTKSLDELLSDVRRLVRGNPAVAVGAAAVVGFAIARFLKATPQNEYQTDYSAGYDDDYRA